MTRQEEQVNASLLITCAIATAISGLGAVGVLIASAVEFHWAMVLVFALLATVTACLGWATHFYAEQVQTDDLVFKNPMERAVLNRQQRKLIRSKRGEVVLEAALVEVEHERENITHKQLEDADNPDTPPYETQWTRDADLKAKARAITEPRRCDHGFLKGGCTYPGCVHY